MNITFTLLSDELTKAFIAEAADKSMVALKGYRTVGGIRVGARTTPCPKKAVNAC